MADSRALRLWLILVLLVEAPFIRAQNNGAELQKQLESVYPLTQATVDYTDIVKAGAVLVLQKDGLQMCNVTVLPMHNFYKNGQLTQGGFMSAINKFNASMGGEVTNRRFAAGEKFWVTRIDVGNDGVTFHLLSDPLPDLRYHAMLKFPFPKGQTPPAEQMLATVAEVIKPDESAGTAEPQQQVSAAPAPAETKTIALGQSKDQVLKTFGPPAKVAQLGSKEIDYYSDMKVTFTNNVVTNVE
jgi:hypothetical protein